MKTAEEFLKKKKYPFGPKGAGKFRGCGRIPVLTQQHQYIRQSQFFATSTPPNESKKKAKKNTFTLKFDTSRGF